MNGYLNFCVVCLKSGSGSSFVVVVGVVSRWLSSFNTIQSCLVLSFFFILGFIILCLFIFYGLDAFVILDCGDAVDNFSDGFAGQIMLFDWVCLIWPCVGDDDLYGDFVRHCVGE